MISPPSSSRRSPRRLWAILVAAGAAASAGVLITAALTASGCTDDCHETCGSTSVYVGSADGNTAIPISDPVFNGPACPGPHGTCIGTPTSPGCTHFTVMALGPGSCDVGIAFTDRAPEIIHLQFGEKKPCCPGYPVVGDTDFIVPESPDAGITGSTSGADAITILTDAGAPDAN